MPRIVIVGAGISGLALAYRLQQQAPGLDITVLEQADRPGGKIWTHRQEGFQVEAGPNGFLDTKPATLALCRDLGLSDQLVPASAVAGQNRYLFLDGRLRPLPGDVRSFLTTDLLSWRGKLNLVLERFRRRPRPKDDESIDAFARRRAGPEVADVFADALVTGIHAGDPRLLSVRAAFPRLAEMEARHGSVLKGLGQVSRQRRAEAQARGTPPIPPLPRGEQGGTGTMWSLRPGLRLLMETLQRQLQSPPLLGVAVRRLTQQGAPRRPTWRIGADGHDSWDADAVVLTCPAYQQACLLADADRDLAEYVGGIAYNRIAVVALGYRRADVPGPVAGFGFIAPQRTRRDLLGVQWCSSIFPDRAPAQAVLLRALAGGWHRPDVAGWDDARLLDATRAELRLAMGITAPPIFRHIVRWDRAIPQYHLGHLKRVAWIQQRVTQHPGLYLGGNAYLGVALNDCTEQGEVLAKLVGEYLKG